jgi:hypothetical protein
MVQISGEVKKFFKIKAFYIGYGIFALLLLLLSFQRLINESSGVYIEGRVSLEGFVTSALLTLFLACMMYLSVIIGVYLSGYEFQNNTYSLVFLYQGKIRQHLYKTAAMLIINIIIIVMTIFLSSLLVALMRQNVDFSINIMTNIKQSGILHFVITTYSIFAYTLGFAIRKLYPAAIIGILFYYLFGYIEKFLPYADKIMKYFFLPNSIMLIYHEFKSFLTNDPSFSFSVSANMLDISFSQAMLVNIVNVLILYGILFFMTLQREGDK